LSGKILTDSNERGEKMELNYKLIGHRMRSIRKLRKLTQAELAEYTGLSVPYISHIENGIKQVSLQALVKVAEALECTADRLLYENWMSVCGGGQSELAELLSGCTAAEQQFLLEVLNAVKNCVIFSRELTKK